MSTLVEIPATQTIPRQTAQRRYADYLIFTLCASLYLLPFMRLYFYSDEGILVGGAIRIFHGQVFARDFLEPIGPGTFYCVAAFFKLFGVSFLATRIWLFISSLGTALGMYFLSRRVCGPYRMLPCILLAGAYFGKLWPSISHHVDSNFSALFSVMCIVCWLNRRGKAWLVAAGALAGATLLFHQSKGGLLFLAMVLWLCWIERLGGPQLLRSLIPFAAGFIAIVGAALVYFWSQGALWDLVYANVLWPLRHYSGVNSVPYAYSLLRLWHSWVGPAGSAWWRIFPAALLWLPYLLVAALPGILVFFGIRKWRSFAKPEILLYWLCGWAMWASELHRKDVGHLVFGAPLLLILCIYYLEQYRARVARMALQAISISAACLACYGLFMSLVAHPEVTRFGTIYIYGTDPILAAVENHVAPGEEIFAYPFLPMYYVLSQTVNPTRYSLLTYNFNTPSEFQEAIRTLESRRVKWVVWDTGGDYLPNGPIFPLPKGVKPDKQVMEPYLESHYYVVQSYGQMRLMERKPDIH